MPTRASATPAAGALRRWAGRRSGRSGRRSPAAGRRGRGRRGSRGPPWRGRERARPHRRRRRGITSSPLVEGVRRCSPIACHPGRGAPGGAAAQEDDDRHQDPGPEEDSQNGRHDLLVGSPGLYRERGCLGATGTSDGGLLASATVVPLAAEVSLAPPAAAAGRPTRRPGPASPPTSTPSATRSRPRRAPRQPGRVSGPRTPGSRVRTRTVQSMRHRLGISTSNAVNLASNGRRMQDFDDQVNQLPSTAQYVVVESAGVNDLCRLERRGDDERRRAIGRSSGRASHAVAPVAPPTLSVFVAIDARYLQPVVPARCAVESVNPVRRMTSPTRQSQARLYWDNRTRSTSSPASRSWRTRRARRAADENRRLSARDAQPRLQPDPGG